MRTAIRLTVSTLLLIAVATVAGLNLSLGTPVAATTPGPVAAAPTSEPCTFCPSPTPTVFAATTPSDVPTPMPVIVPPAPEPTLEPITAAPTPCQSYPCDGKGNSNGPFAPGPPPAGPAAPAAPAPAPSLQLSCGAIDSVVYGHITARCIVQQGQQRVDGASLDVRVTLTDTETPRTASRTASGVTGQGGLSGTGSYQFDVVLPSDWKDARLSFPGSTATWNGMTASL